MIDIALRKTLQAEERRFVMDVRLRSDSRRVVLFGPSGSGKSLTLRAVAGLLRPDSGHIAVNGRVFYDGASQLFLPPRQRRVAYLFQDYALFPHLTVGQNVAFALRGGWLNPRRRGMPAQARRWIDAFELGPVINSYPSQISGGRSSAPHWRGPWRPSPSSSCWMSRFPRWMRNCAARCGWSCAACSTACPCR